MIAGRPAWMADAACRGMDPDLFFPERGEATDLPRSVCAHCPVREQCLAYALTEGIKSGVWGGSTERQRRRLRKVAA